MVTKKNEPMDKFKIWRKYYNIPVIIELNDKSILYGGIIGINSDSINTTTIFYVLENLNKHKYDETQDKSLLTSVPYEEIKNIKYQIP